MKTLKSLNCPTCNKFMSNHSWYSPKEFIYDCFSCNVGNYIVFDHKFKILRYQFYMIRNNHIFQISSNKNISDIFEISFNIENFIFLEYDEIPIYKIPKFLPLNPKSLKSNVLLNMDKLLTLSLFK